MIRDVERWRAFEADWVARQKPDFYENLRLVDAMYELARTFGHFTAEDALDGLEATVRVARTINSV